MKSVIVTGGAGYIGSHACKALHQAGFVPVSYDNLSHGHETAVRWGPLVVGDIDDRIELERTILRYKPVAVMHFAAFASVGESVSHPEKYYRNNVAGALTLFEAARANGLKAVIFSSTAAVYGMPKAVPIAETSELRPINPYGRSKLMMEQMLVDFHEAYGLASVCLRYFNAAGADPAGEIGEDHEPETHLIPRALMAASGEIGELDLFGTDYATPDGTAVRDYIHVTDLAEAHVLALRYALEKGGATQFNLGTGAGFSVLEIIAAVERITGRKLPVRIAPRRAGDPARLVADPACAKRELGFVTHHSDIDSIVRTAWQWQQKASRGRRQAASLSRRGSRKPGVSEPAAGPFVPVEDAEGDNRQHSEQRV